jgi:hypothetical protein
MNKNAERKMGNLKLALTLCGLAAVCLQGGIFAAGQTPSARSIMEGVYRQDTSHSIVMRANFQVYDQQGHSAKKDFIYRRIGSPGDSKTLVVFTAPAEIRGVALLSVNQPGSADRQYIYTPATQRVRSVVAQERSARFIGTDFSFEDIGERVLDDFNYRLMSANESIDGHKAYKVEATPVDSSRSQYKYIYYWVGRDVPVILYAEMYDAQGKLVRVLHASDLKREGGIWGARHTEMRSVQDGTRTVFTIDQVKFNTQLDESWFTPEGMAGAAGAGK